MCRVEWRRRAARMRRTAASAAARAAECAALSLRPPGEMIAPCLQPLFTNFSSSALKKRSFAIIIFPLLSAPAPSDRTLIRRDPKCRRAGGFQCFLPPTEMCQGERAIRRIARGETIAHGMHCSAHCFGQRCACDAVIASHSSGAHAVMIIYVWRASQSSFW